MSLIGRKCPSCGARMPENARFCGQCGFDTGTAYTEGIDSLRMALENEVNRDGREDDTGEIPNPTETSKWPAGEKKKSYAGVIRLAATIVMTVAVFALAVTLINEMSRPHQQDAAEPMETIHVVSMDKGKPKTPAPTTPGPAAKAQITPAGETVYAIMGMNLRDNPGTDGTNIMDSVAKGTALTRIGSEDGWSHVLYKGKEYYAKDSLLTTEEPDETPTPEEDEEEPEETEEPEATDTPEPVPTPKEPSGTLTATSNVNVRKGPGTSFKVIGVVDAGEKMEYTDYIDGWYMIDYDGQEGYVARNMVREDDDAE